MRKLVLLMAGMLILLGACSNKETSDSQTNITVSAAASLTDALTDLKKTFEEENKQIKLTVNLGGSGTLAQQIEQGAPVDVFLSANEKWMDTLEEEQLIDTHTRTDFTGNKIVLIADKNASFPINSFKQINKGDIGQIAIGNPDSVPAGKYAKESLEAINKWEELKSQLVFAKDVRQVLAFVESGNTDIGFVYASDALISDKVKILAEAQPEWHKPIIYPAAVIAASKKSKAAKDFIDFLKTDKAQSILSKYGFKK